MAGAEERDSYLDHVVVHHDTPVSVKEELRELGKWGTPPFCHKVRPKWIGAGVENELFYASPNQAVVVLHDSISRSVVFLRLACYILTRHHK
eukprot:6210800-Pleurochrysis_carterae.AAC.3